jgi:hypothetical protein
MILKTAHDVHDAVSEIIKARALNVANSEYDRVVLIDAVAASRKAADAVAIEGSSTLYHAAIQSQLNTLFSTYNDTSGQYTNGRAAIGDILSDIAQLSQHLT